ncbi:MAG: hypothetical protein B0A82_15035 [Alkalinema sp. CACIAM 70d]|nr:MAG: hypothetical protein B0A82_15035 [Alkalinema sp. CACIAM 70d]
MARALSSHSLDTPEKRAVVVKELKDLTKAIQDPIVRQFYDNEFFVRTGRELFGRNRNKRFEETKTTKADIAEAFKLTSAYFEQKKRIMVDTLISSVSIGILLHHKYIDDELLESSLQMRSEHEELNSLRDEIVHKILSHPPGFFDDSTLVKFYSNNMDKFLSSYSRFGGQSRRFLPAYARPEADQASVIDGIRNAIGLYRFTVTLPLELEYEEKSLVGMFEAEAVSLEMYNRAMNTVQGIRYEMLALSKLVGGPEVEATG